MQHDATPCQLEHAQPSDIRGISTTRDALPIACIAHTFEYSAAQTPLVRGDAQEVEHTASRQSGPRRWRRAVAWVVAAGLHPRTNATTLAVANDLAGRMDYTTGHVRYCMEDTAARLGISVASVKRHIGYLREAGLLAWAVHGTRRNIRAVLGLGGYAATATVYAAVIPPVYDHAMGHQVTGAGYGAHARIVTDQRAPAGAVDNCPVDNACSEGLEPPSLSLVSESGQVLMGGGFNYTPREGARRQTESAATPDQTQKRSSDKTARRSPLQVAREIRETRLVRSMVTWTQPVPLRRLSFVLRPMFDRGLQAHDIAGELHGMCLGWTPARPAEYIQAALAEQAQHQAMLDAGTDPMDNPEWRAYVDGQNSLEAMFGEEQRTDDDRLRARLDWNAWPEVADHYAEDPDDAIDLYGVDYVTYAIKRSDQYDARETR